MKKEKRQKKGPENKGNKEENELFLCDYIGGMGQIQCEMMESGL